ncbi:acyltransferase family protein [Cupriavidus agavae]|uniref:Acyltransferase 3 domain-containing protein n=1 Tax=Cupriavidus agavae TaxID=1001822 RepID=A0A4V2FHZ8_9BURK|nr:acyltransferase [Cupriavidus agavae]RZT42029.1 hypothetical protein EV147_1045 [Cupriavidus agavae]
MLTNIQALRAVAALVVVLSHLLVTARSYGQPVSLALPDGWGDFGVDVFFVISGFVMVYTQDRRRRTAGEFLRNRLWRIVPIYWLLTGAMIALLMLAPGAFRDETRSAELIVSSLLFVSTLVADRMAVLYVGWSLEYEMLFYGLFALGLLFRRERDAFLFPVVALVVLVGLGWSRPLALEFVFGMGIARLHRAGMLPLGLPLAALGAGLLAATLVWRPDADRLLTWGVPAALLVHGALTMRQTASRILVYLGDASYSIYLLQVFTLPAFYKFSTRHADGLPYDLLGVLALGWTVAAACLFYQYVERPLLALGRKKPGRSRADGADALNPTAVRNPD